MRELRPYIFFVYLAEGNKEAMKNLKRTVEEGIPITQIEKYLNREILEKIKRITINNKVFAWGSKPGPGNLRFYNKMAENDYFFIFVSGKLKFIAKIGPKIRSKDLSREFWGDESWELIYFLKEIKNVDVEEEKVVEEVGTIPRWGLNRFGDEKLKRIKENHETIENFINYLTGEKIKEIEVLKINEDGIKEILNNLVLDETILHQIVTALKEGKHVILTGPPGTGKTTLAQWICEKVFGVSYEILTSDPEWTSWDIFGAPLVTPSGEVKFIEGLLTRIIKESSESKEPTWLIIDEINRTKVDEVFSGLLTDLERGILKYTKIARDEETGELKREIETLRIPETFRIIGTMNTFDVALLFDLGYAFKRRFMFFEITPPHPNDENYTKFEEKERTLIEEKTKLSSELLDKLFEFIRSVRQHRLIGTAFIIETAEAAKIWINKLGKEALEKAIISKIFPQLEGLTIDAINTLLDDAKRIFGEDSIIVRRLEQMTRGEGVTKVLIL